jgi:hypothetical protein
MEIIVAMFWAIWTARNDVIFRNLHRSVQACKLVFKQELVWVKLRGKRDIGLQLQLWLDNFVKSRLFFYFVLCLMRCTWRIELKFLINSSRGTPSSFLLKKTFMWLLRSTYWQSTLAPRG